jgi:bacterioferritin-associated ferredoxin
MEKGSAPLNLVCFCNHVAASTVRDAISKGADTLSKIYDSTGAGSGPCGGSCREKLKLLLSQDAKSSSSTADPDQQPVELVEAVSLFNRRFFWEAHEVLEHLWLEEQGDRKVLYQGIIQAAACFYHVLNANPQGALKLSKDAQQKLDPFRPRYLGIELDLLCERLQIFHDQAKEILGTTREGFSYDLLPKLKIGGEMQP